MDSRSRRLPSLPSLRSSYASSPGMSSSTTSSLGSSRLYGRDSVLNNDRFPRASSAYKADLDKQSSCLLGSSRDYGSSESRSASWKMPSSRTSVSSRSYDCPWAESSLSSSSSSSRSKLTDSEGRLGMRSVLLNAADDGDSKRAKLSYSNRGLYSRTPGSSVSPSTYSTSGLSSGRGACEKTSDVLDSARSSRHLLSWSSSSSASSKPLRSRRELESSNEPTLSSLRDRRMSSPGLTSSLYQTDRMTSTYAQGARPKETSYLPSSSSSSSYSSSARDGSLSSRHLLSSAPHLIPLPLRDYSNRASSRYSTTTSSSSSSGLHTSQAQTGNPASSSDPSSSSSSSAYSGRSSWQSARLARAEARPPPRAAPEAAEAEGRRSTRHLLSRLFSRRSSQDSSSSSSSSSSSARSLDEDSPSPGGDSADSDEGARPAEEARSRRADLAPIRESDGEALRGGPARPGRAAGAGGAGGGGGGGGSSWLSSSLRGRCPPLLARLRGYARDESTHTATSTTFSSSSSSSSGERRGSPQRLLRRWYNLEHGGVSACDDDDDEEDEEEDDDDEDEEENEGEQREAAAAGAEALAAGSRRSRQDQQLPELEDASLSFLLRRRVGLPEQLPTPAAPLRGAESQPDPQREKSTSGRDEEKLRKIKERLLLEESDEEEGDLCRICQMGEESAANPLIQPCCCTGSLQYVHQDCIKRWLHSKIVSGTSFEAVTTCELCKEKLRLHMDNFDVQELYRTYVQSEYDEFICSGLYLVVLLHYCEQRFSDVLGAFDAAGFFSLLRIINEHMDSLEGNQGDSEAEAPDTRPSIDFSDLDDDLDDE